MFKFAVYFMIISWKKNYSRCSVPMTLKMSVQRAESYKAQAAAGISFSTHVSRVWAVNLKGVRALCPLWTVQRIHRRIELEWRTAAKLEMANMSWLVGQLSSVGSDYRDVWIERKWKPKCKLSAPWHDWLAMSAVGDRRYHMGHVFAVHKSRSWAQPGD